VWDRGRRILIGAWDLAKMAAAALGRVLWRLLPEYTPSEVLVRDENIPDICM
jgi:hypothetical protein